MKKTDFDPEVDIIVLAETFVPLVPSLFPGIPKIIFNQNASYTFGLPSKTIYKPSAITAIYHHHDVLQVWCVSRSDYNFLIRGLDLPISNVHRVVNAIDFELEPIQSFQKASNMLHVSKNSLDSACVLNILREKKWLKDWNFIEIKNLKHAEVISVMRIVRFFFLSATLKGLAFLLPRHWHHNVLLSATTALVVENCLIFLIIMVYLRLYLTVTGLLLLMLHLNYTQNIFSTQIFFFANQNDCLLLFVFNIRSLPCKNPLKWPSICSRVSQLQSSSI